MGPGCYPPQQVLHGFPVRVHEVSLKALKALHQPSFTVFFLKPFRLKQQSTYVGLPAKHILDHTVKIVKHHSMSYSYSFPMFPLGIIIDENHPFPSNID